MAGKAVIFSAPSGSGKTTIVQQLLTQNSDLSFSISASTRQKRSTLEQHGKDYYFLPVADFKQKIEKGDFIEWEEVYPDVFYGTLKSEIERIQKDGKNVIFDVDVKGGMALKKYFGKEALAIYVDVPSLKVLEERLRMRDTESEESIQKRLSKSIAESAYKNEFDKVLVNDDLQKAVSHCQNLYNEFRNS